MNATTTTVPPISQYTLTIIFLIGNLSNLANIFVFLQKSLRSNVCSWYFLLVSLGHLIFLYFVCLIRLLTNWLGYDVTGISIIFCRIRIYFPTISLLISRYFLCLISIDRWMITSNKISTRQLSSLKIVRWLIINGISFSLIFSIIMPIWYRIEESRTSCIGALDSFYPLFYTIYNLIIIFLPFFLMILFSLLAIKNLREIKIHPISITNNKTRVHRKDLQFIKLSLIQVLIYVLLNTFYAYNVTYTFITQSIIKSDEQIQLDSLFSIISLNMSYLYTAVKFLSI